MSIFSKIATQLSERLAIAREGIVLMLLADVAAIILWCGAAVTGSKTLLWAAVLMTLAIGGIAFFFRNPRRAIPTLTSRDILSPADGKVMNIAPAPEQEFLKREAVRISIFLSLVDVHINRIPVSGTVRYKKSSEGKSLPAFFENAGNSNKCTAIGIECDDGFCMTVVQITGLVARRIVCNLDLNQSVKRGESYGMICFGSRVDVYLPRETSLDVRVGDRVYAGLTVIGQKAS